MSLTCSGEGSAGPRPAAARDSISAFFFCLISTCYKKSVVRADGWGLDLRSFDSMSKLPLCWWAFVQPASHRSVEHCGLVYVESTPRISYQAKLTVLCKQSPIFSLLAKLQAKESEATLVASGMLFSPPSARCACLSSLTERLV